MDSNDQHLFSGSTPTETHALPADPKNEPLHTPVFIPPGQSPASGLFGPSQQGALQTPKGPSLVPIQLQDIKITPTSTVEPITQSQLNLALNPLLSSSTASNVAPPIDNPPTAIPMFVVDGQLYNQAGQLVHGAPFGFTTQQQNVSFEAQTQSNRSGVMPLAISLPSAPSVIGSILNKAVDAIHPVPALEIKIEQPGPLSLGSGKPANAPPVNPKGEAAMEMLAGKAAKASDRIVSDTARYRELESMQRKVLSKEFRPVNSRNISHFMNYNQIPTWKSAAIQERVDAWAIKSAEQIRQALLLEIQSEMLHLKSRRDLVAKDVHINQGKVFGLLAKAREALGL